MLKLSNRMQAYLSMSERRIETIGSAIKALEKTVGISPRQSHGKKLLKELKRYKAQIERSGEQMKAHAATADARIKKLSEASNGIWAIYREAIGKSRKAFARANRKGSRAIRRAVR